VSSFTRSYQITNIVVLGLSVYCLAFPFLMSRFGDCLPAFFTNCPSRLIWNQPCPLCGISRGLLALSRLDISAASAYNPLTLSLVFFAAGEIAFRSTVLLGRFRESLLHRVARFDLLFHLLAGAFYLGYAGFFVARMSLSPA